MKFRKSLIFNVTIAVIVASCLLAFSGRGFLKRMELGSMDLLFRLRGLSLCSPNIVIIEIDDENISKIGRWPWSRKWHTAIVKALGDLGAEYIYFDVIFSEVSTEEDDFIFTEAIKEAGNVYLPFSFQGRSQDFEDAILPIERFSSHIKGTGSINVYPDIDGVLRSIPLFFMSKENVYYNMALTIAMDYSDLKIKEIAADYLVMANAAGKETKIPLIEKNKMLINWTGQWGDAFKHYSFLEVLAAYKASLEGKKPDIDLEPFKNSICIVAVTAIGLFDIKPTPIQSEYPSVGGLATLISNISENKFMQTPSLWVKWTLVYILTLTASLLISGKNPLREFFLTTCVGVVFFTSSFVFFKRGIIINFSLPLLGLLVNYITISTYNFARVSIEKQRLSKLANTDGLTNLYNQSYFKIVLKAERLAARSEVNGNKGFCVAMIDIDNFKHFNDTYGHQVGDLVLKEVANILKSSMRSSDVVARYGGEEMILLLKNASLKNGLTLTEKIRKAIDEHQLVGEKGEIYKVTISAGVSAYNFQDDEKTIIFRADQALYKAKNSGRNRVAAED
ncbi:MAG: diguanylate cyclase [Candidatus Omnitrophica bacterium]|nr:diguanylate cyclase [Candidatus Omnitrophota bacterium]